MSRATIIASFVAALLASGCDGGPPPPDGVVATVDDLFTTEELGSCLYASPQVVSRPDGDVILSITLQGRVLGIDPETGEILHEVLLPSTVARDQMQQLSTPAIVHDELAVIAWQEATEDFSRIQRVVVVDLLTWALHPGFEQIEVATTAPSVPTHDGAGVVEFAERWQLQRARLVHRDVDDRELGLVYLAYGNGPSEQPFHGWLFELDLDAWRDGGAASAFANALVSTAENDCGPPGNRMASVCGGGIWAAWGPQIYERPGGEWEIVVATGNGRQDLDVGAYAHALMRTQRGLSFEHGCDPALCEPFDELLPDPACQASCVDLFMARPMPGDPPIGPVTGECDGLTFLECYGVLDYDLGSSTPVEVQVPGGPRVFVQPGKDGAMYLIDAERMGTLYQRLQVRDFCGHPDSACAAHWAGMFVTAPAVAEVDGTPVVIVASQIRDGVHYSGISAYDVVMDGDEPRLVTRWEVPERDSAEGAEGFREQPGFPVVVDVGGEPHVFVAESRRSLASPPGRLWGVRVRDGYVAVRQDLDRSGNRYVRPLVHDGTIYVNDCDPSAWDTGLLQAYRIGTR